MRYVFDSKAINESPQMLVAAPDYKVGSVGERYWSENIDGERDFVRKKIYFSANIEESVSWILKNKGRYREPETWIFDVTINWCSGPAIVTDKIASVVRCKFAKCGLPDGDVQFIECTLPVDWDGKVNAIDCEFTAESQQEAK